MASSLGIAHPSSASSLPLPELDFFSALQLLAAQQCWRRRVAALARTSRSPSRLFPVSPAAVGGCVDKGFVVEVRLL